jgi:YVTN family beta-propeller protein
LRRHVINANSDNVSVIGTRTNTVITTIPADDLPNGVAITPNGRRAYVTNLNSGTVSVIDTRTNTVVTTIRVGTWPRDVAFTRRVTEPTSPTSWTTPCR